ARIHRWTKTASSAADCPIADACGRGSGSEAGRSPVHQSAVSRAPSCPAQGRSNQLDGRVRHPALIETAAVEPTWMCRPCPFQFAPARKDRLIPRGTCSNVETIDDELSRSPAHCLEAGAIVRERHNRPCK